MRNRSGFTIIELIFVLMLSGIVMAVGVQQYNRVANQRAVGNARDALILTSLRARSEAVRSGQLVHMRVRPDLGLVRVETSDGRVLHTLRSADYRTQMVGSQLSVCYSSRGYALSGCTAGLGAERGVGFVRGRDTAAVSILPLGQVRRRQ